MAFKKTNGEIGVDPPDLPTVKVNLNPNKRIIEVYLDNGVIFSYEVDSPGKVREHTSAIIKTGYRHNDGLIFEHYPPHRILKVKSNNIPTKYPDTISIPKVELN
jgi:hypothetical protein